MFQKQSLIKAYTQVKKAVPKLLLKGHQDQEARDVSLIDVIL